MGAFAITHWARSRHRVSVLKSLVLENREAPRHLQGASFYK